MNSSLQAVRIRPMTPADLDRVIAIAASLRNAPHWPRAAYQAALDPETAPRRIALVAEDAGLVEGFVVASLLPPQAELELIAVAAASQRRGLARRLFAELAAELRAARLTEVILEARASNQQALDFYQRMGWLVSGRRTRYYQNPEEDALLMRLWL
jgi:ribosomal-protein-alanine N-acetyltransferase